MKRNISNLSNVKADIQAKRTRNDNPHEKDNVVLKDSQNITHSMNKIATIFNLETTFDKQLSLILSEISANPKYYRCITYILDDLSNIIHMLYPNRTINVYPFGSAVTGLALKGSDVDLFIDFNGEIPEKFVQSLRKINYKARLFFKLIYIPARIPIIRCEHKSRVPCDISYSNFLGVANSNLIKYYLDMDSRLKPVILILKFLMKTHGLVSTNNITSFSVILLTLFYVQQLDEPLVPTACELQQLAANKHIVNNWNVSFTKDRDHTSRNTMSIPDLITGFFKFYTNFEFGLYLISLFTGKSYLKSIFANQNTIPVEFSHYTDNLINNRCDKFELHKYMCVQGPFNHAHNTTRNVNQKTLINFQYFCQKNSQVLDNSQHNDDGQFLKTLFSQKDMSNEKHTAVREAMVYIGENIDFSMCTNVTEDALREHWANITVDKLKDILSQVLKCNVTTNNEKPSFGNEFKCLNCELDYPELVTNIRKDAREEFSFPKDMPLIVKETLISDYLLEKRLKGFKQTHFKFNVQCSMLRGPTRINFKLLCNESAKPKMHIIVSVFNFIQNSCVKWLQAVV